MWRDVQAKIDKGKGKPDSWRLHFCPVCGLDISKKFHVFIHAKIHHKDSHPDFATEDAVLLDDVERYYHCIKNLKNPCGRAKHFIKMVENPIGPNENQKVLPPSVKKFQQWLDLKAKIDNTKGKPESHRLHFCPVCGLDCVQKWNVFTHAKRQHKESHPDFAREYAVLLDDVEQYYHYIKKLKNPCGKAKHFIKMVENPIEPHESKKVLSPSVKKLQQWIDLQAKIDKGKGKPDSWRLHFCPVCGLDITEKGDVFRHAKTHHKESHPDFATEDAVLLDDVERYYHYIKKLKNPCGKAKHFIKMVENPIEPHENQKVLPPSVKKLQQWIDLQAKIDNTKGKRQSWKLHFCPVCGLDCVQKCNVFKHAKRQHKESHPDFAREDVVLLDDVERYYHHIKKLKKDDLHQAAQQFIKMVKQEIRTNKTKRNKRKRFRPRQAPPDVACATRFKKPKIPLGCENEIYSGVQVKLEEDVKVKLEPGLDSANEPFSGEKLLDANVQVKLEPLDEDVKNEPLGPVKVESEADAVRTKEDQQMK